MPVYYECSKFRWEIWWFQHVQTLRAERKKKKRLSHIGYKPILLDGRSSASDNSAIHIDTIEQKLKTTFKCNIINFHFDDPDNMP